MHHKWNETKSGMITVEASIVVPIVLLVIASLIYMTFYVHDIISIRSGVYSMVIENNKTGMPSLFVMNPKVVKTETGNKIKIQIHMNSKAEANFLKNIINSESEESLTIQKTMNTDILYAGRAMIDAKKEGGD